jgi:hypothetical protein
VITALRANVHAEIGRAYLEQVDGRPSMVDDRGARPHRG